MENHTLRLLTFAPCMSAPAIAAAVATAAFCNAINRNLGLKILESYELN
jgi:hypothetical protein